jgi:hypothetical protein
MHLGRSLNRTLYCLLLNLFVMYKFKFVCNGHTLGVIASIFEMAMVKLVQLVKDPADWTYDGQVVVDYTGAEIS